MAVAMEMQCTLCFEDLRSQQPGGALLDTEAKCFICSKFACQHPRRNPLLATQGQDSGQQKQQRQENEAEDQQGKRKAQEEAEQDSVHTESSRKRARIPILLNAELWQNIVMEHTQDNNANVMRNILFAEDKAFHLTGRNAATTEAISHFTKIMSHHINRKEGTDKRAIRLPICSGVPGLGKTRMLEDWRKMVSPAIDAIAQGFRSVGQNFECSPRFVLVKYYNGHDLQDCEKNGAPICSSFLLRLLFDYFLCGRATFSTFMEAMMRSGIVLTLDTVLDLIVKAEVESVTKERPLCLFLGVDEYQAMNRLQKKKEEEEDEEDLEVPYTRVIANMLGTYMSEPTNEKLILLPMFAGTDFDVEPGAVTNSSCIDTARLPLSYLSPPELQELLKSHPTWGGVMTKLCESPTVRRHLFLLGGVPRFAVEYGKAAKDLATDGRSPSDDDLTRVFGDIWTLRAAKWSSSLPEELLLTIVAYAATNASVKPEASLTVGKKSWRWTKLVDMGVCVLEKLASGNYHVVLPYCAFRYCGEMDRLTTNRLSLPMRHLSRCLEYMRIHVDDQVYDCEPWQLWETFGACFHAILINSFLVLGSDTVSVSQLFGGGIGTNDTMVQLRPVEVFRSADPLSKDLGVTVREATNTTYTRTWIGKNNYETGVIVINGTGGVGVDVFFSLPIAHKDTSKVENYMVFLDQRKRVATDTLASSTAKGLIAKARTAYRSDNTVVGLFSMFPRAEIAATDLPDHSFVISKTQAKAYLASMWSHPAACPFIDLQEDNATTLCLLLKGGNKRNRKSFADEIISRRQRIEGKVSDITTLAALAKKYDLQLVPDAATWASF